MTAIYALGGLAAGAVLLGRVWCVFSRLLGAGVLVAAMLFLVAAPAFADQNLVAADSGTVACIASAKDLTRISLVDDGFASVSKIATGNAQDDFTVVNEPVRGDIYLSVPDGFARPALSFFGTTRRGFVYKFVCRVNGEDAAQVFLSNPAIAREQLAEVGPTQRSSEDQAIALTQAMYGGGAIAGYERREPQSAPVLTGKLSVQLIAEYRGPMLAGRVLRIENRGDGPITLDERTVASRDALAVTVTEPRLDPGKATTAYLVSRIGR